jgi:valyl-tRNA synthetase
MNKELSSQYDSKQIEDNIYKLWEESGYFNPDNLPARHKKPFTIIMPPPNANGSLHIGHALFVTLEDIMIRYQRMQGRKALWLPGADHAGFETQVVYNKKLEKEGRSFWDMPREQLYNEIKDFTLANKKYMEGQLKKLGASCDWSREKFTLDESIKEVVNETFEKLYNDGLVYRAEKPVNWCTKHQTTLSDLEIKYEERADKLYYIKYKLANSEEYIEVATTRPETIPADIAIAVHPKSKWAKYIGKKVVNPLTKKEIPVLSDMAVDLNFGTGALKITPFHDAVDFAVWQNHKSEIDIQPFSVINQYGKMTEEAGPEMAGMKVKEAREKSVELLRPNFVKEPEDYKHQVSVCYKCGTIIEPRIMMQWFIRMTEKPHAQNQKSKIKNQNVEKSLRDLAVDAVKSKKIKFIPARFEKIFMHWMKNLHDWNISRQIVWGIQIPAWYCQDMANETCKKNNGVIVSVKNPEKCPHCGSANLKQETDVFDTWFSSGQWPYATLMTTKPGDFEKYYPTDVMETGWDILFFWVARMIMFGLYRTGKIPFKDVYLHGLVRDKERQKMSKSKNNVINPLEVAEVYGTDAVRMALIVGNTAGNDPIISEDKIRGYRNFATKIWNASRFVLMNYRTIDAKPKLTAKDKKNLKDLETAKKKIAKYLDKYDFNHAAETAYHYFWHTFADKVIEESKPRIRPENENLADAAAAQETLIKILEESMKFLHPFMPFITEQIYQILPTTKEKSLLMVEEW